MTLGKIAKEKFTLILEEKFAGTIGNSKELLESSLQSAVVIHAIPSRWHLRYGSCDCAPDLVMVLLKGLQMR